jgi:uncharacterized protein YndB with AHSA1/START domain
LQVQEEQMPDHCVSRSTVIAAAREDVWDALIDPSRLAEWLADEVEAAELEPDGEVVFRWDDGRERRGVIEAVDAPERLALRWAAGDGRENSVVFELAEDDGGTRVTVTESGLSAPDARAAWSSRLTMFALSACAVAA